MSPINKSVHRKFTETFPSKESRKRARFQSRGSSTTPTPFPAPARGKNRSRVQPHGSKMWWGRGGWVKRGRARLAPGFDFRYETPTPEKHMVTDRAEVESRAARAPQTSWTTPRRRRPQPRTRDIFSLSVCVFVYVCLKKIDTVTLRNNFLITFLAIN